MHYETTYKSRKITIKPMLNGKYKVTRTLGLSVKSNDYFPNATSALKWMKAAIDSNELPLTDRWVVFGW
jgi:hypothetical protein